jgi:3-oxoacyl-[acyl-carrier protein] reductase
VDLELRGKTAIVTGASRGIGRDIAIRLAGEGAKVALCSRDSGALKEVQRELEPSGVLTLVIPMDVTKSAEVTNAIAQANKELGRVDILVNNAGDLSEGAWALKAEDLDDADWRFSFEANLLGAVHCTREVAPLMKRQGGGAIVNVASIWGHQARSHLVDYFATKAALISYSKSMALKLIDDHIRVNCVCPGRIDTALWQRAAKKLTDGSEKAAKQFLDSHARPLPIGRFGKAEEIASVVSFLASERASFVVGATWDVDGGESIQAI